MASIRMRYATFLGEASEEWSYMKFPYYKPLGYPGGKYRVGPLARLNVAKSAGTQRADRELHEFKQRSTGAVCQSFHYHLARLIEMLHAVERIDELTDDPDLLGEHVRAKAGQNRREGIGCCEAPRGTLFHHYQVNDSGLIDKVNLLIATSQNNLAMNMAVEQTARYFVSSRAIAGRHAESRGSGHPLLRSLPLLLHSRHRPHAADRGAARSERRAPRSRRAKLIGESGESRPLHATQLSPSPDRKGGVSPQHGGF